MDCFVCQVLFYLFFKSSGTTTSYLSTSYLLLTLRPKGAISESILASFSVFSAKAQIFPVLLSLSIALIILHLVLLFCTLIIAWSFPKVNTFFEKNTLLLYRTKVRPGGTRVVPGYFEQTFREIEYTFRLFGRIFEQNFWVKKERGLTTSHGEYLPRLESRISLPSRDVWFTFIYRITWRPCGRELCHQGLTRSTLRPHFWFCLASLIYIVSISYFLLKVNTFLKVFLFFFALLRPHPITIVCLISLPFVPLL